MDPTQQEWLYCREKCWIGRRICLLFSCFPHLNNVFINTTKVGGGSTWQTGSSWVNLLEVFILCSWKLYWTYSIAVQRAQQVQPKAVLKALWGKDQSHSLQYSFFPLPQYLLFQYKKMHFKSNVVLLPKIACMNLKEGWISNNQKMQFGVRNHFCLQQGLVPCWTNYWNSSDHPPNTQLSQTLQTDTDLLSGISTP